MEQIRRVEITVLGHQYAIKTDEDEAFIQRIAQYINERSQEITQSTQQINTLDVVIKTAISITEELFRLKSENETFHRTVEQNSKRLIEQIDNQMNNNDVADSDQPVSRGSV